MSLSVFAKDVKLAEVAGGLKKPLCFVENKGQLTDQNGNSRADIQYKLSTPGMSLFIGNGQLHYQFKKIDKGETPKVATYRMDVTLLGANAAAKVVASGEQEYFEQYYMPQCNANGLTAHSWNKIVYKDVYPSIDWVLYVKDDQVEYDFVVRKGGDAGAIKLKYNGATAMKITKDGSLSVNTPMGRVTEKTPYAYETESGKVIASNFKLQGNTVTFETGVHTGSITIDPSLSWSTYFGGTGQEAATCITAMQSPGLNTYIGGYATSPGLATAGAFQTAFGGGVQDAFLAKYNNLGVVQFITYFGGAGSSKANSVCLDPGAGNVYLAGVTTSSAFGLTTGGAYHMASAGGNDGFLIKFNNGGARQWCTFYGGPGSDAINGVTVDPAGFVYIAGQTTSSTLIASAGVYQPALSGSMDAFVAKFSATGAIQWSTYYGGSGQDLALGIVYDGAGKVDITGQTNSVISMASPGAHQAVLSGTNDAFIAQFSAAGVRQWGTYYGGTGTEQGNGIASDAAGNIAIVGNTTSAGGIATARGFQTIFGGIQDAFTAYLRNDGTVQWGSYYGGANLDYGQAVCFDLNSNVVIAGGAFSATGIATANSLQPAIGGDYDAFIAKINPVGQTLWNTYFGGTFYDYANGVACDQAGQLTLAGYTSSTGNFGAGGISTTGSAQAANAGGIYDAFITKFKVDTLVTVQQPYTDTLVCAGGSFSVNYVIATTPAPAAAFMPGNIFSVELSGPAGSFAAPVTIGSIAATTSGSIPVTIPVGALGTQYRIRIVASNPGFVSPDNYYDIHIVASIAASGPSANSPSCIGGTIAFNDTATYDIASWLWTGPVGFVSTLQNPVITGVTIANAGTYSVTTVHTGCPASTATTSVVVNNVFPPRPSVGHSFACAGSNLSLTASADTIAPGITFHWSGPAGFTSTVQNPVITGATVANSGIYYVTDTFAGCPSSLVPDTVLVAANTPVTATMTALNPGYITGRPGDTVCVGTLVNFTASVYNGGSTPTYQWYAGGAPVIGAITSTWASSSLTDGENVVCVINSSALCPVPANAASNAIKMNVLENAPLVFISAGPGLHVTPGSTVVFTSAVYNGGIAPAYQWYKNGVAIPGASSSTYTLLAVNAPDTITLKVTSTMQCTVPDSFAISNALVAESNVGVTHLSAALTDIQLFPNPNSGTFTIKGTLQTDGEVGYQVTNLLGQVITAGSNTPHNNEIEKTISLGNMADGIYLLQLKQSGQDKIFRFSVTR